MKSFLVFTIFVTLCLSSSLVSHAKEKAASQINSKNDVVILRSGEVWPCLIDKFLPPNIYLKRISADGSLGAELKLSVAKISSIEFEKPSPARESEKESPLKRDVKSSEIAIADPDLEITYADWKRLNAYEKRMFSFGLTHRLIGKKMIAPTLVSAAESASAFNNLASVLEVWIDTFGALEVTRPDAETDGESLSIREILIKANDEKRFLAAGMTFSEQG